MTDPLKLPKQKDVKEFDYGEVHAAIVKLTPENREYMSQVAMSMYLGESCKYCGKVYETLDDLKNTVYAGPHEHGRLACESCWKANN